MRGVVRAGTLWLTYGVASLAAVLIGCWVARASGAASATAIVNLAAWGGGAVLALAMSRIRPNVAPWLLGLALAGLVLTLVSGGLSGVHRWVAIGPLRLNSAEVLLPLALAAGAGMEAASRLRLLFPLAATLLLAAQPDASQALAVAGAAGVILVSAKLRPALTLGVAAGVLAAVIVTAMRPDPLEPVAEVEGIFGLAYALSPVTAALAVSALTAAVLTPLLMARSREAAVRQAAWALAVYFAFTAMAPAAGAFPVPLVGMGVSPIVGGWLGIGWLMRLGRTAKSDIAPGSGIA